MNSAQKKAPVSLVESRNTERTLGCVGFSIIAHVAFLAALAVAPNSIREMGDTGHKAGADEAVSMVDVAETSEAVAKGAVPLTEQPAEAAPTPDSSSDVIVGADAKPENVAKSKPVAKVQPKPVVVKSVKPAVTSNTTAQNAPVITDESAETEAMPTLLANPPSDGASSDSAAQEEIPVQDASSEQEAATSPVPKAAASVAAAPTAAAPAKTLEDESAADESADETAEAPVKSALAAAPIEGPATSAVASAGVQSAGGGSPGAVVGPIRDASELKALPGNSNPVYPARDRLARKEGMAVLLGRVSPDGHVTELKLEKSSGSPMMDAAAVQAFRSWRFQAGQEGWVRKPFQFRLVGDAKEVPAPLGKPLTR